MRSWQLSFAVAIGLAAGACTTANVRPENRAVASLETDAGRARASDRRPSEAGQYFVEFRARYALSYGHSFLVHGKLDRNGQIGPLTDKNVAGFHPKGAGPELWTVGHAVPVPAETGPSDGDLEEEYVSARYRVVLNGSEYRGGGGPPAREGGGAARIREMQASSAPWHAVLYNCNAWIGNVARHMGLQAPAVHVIYPAAYINEMRRLNGDRPNLG